MKTHTPLLGLVPVLLVTAARPAAPPSGDTVTILVQSTVPLHPVRFTIVGHGLAQVIADSGRIVPPDTVIALTPARLTVSDGSVHVLLRADPGEPWLFLSSVELGHLEAWGNHVELKRDSTTTRLQVLAPALRSAP